jgi:hypothetical protein
VPIIDARRTALRRIASCCVRSCCDSAYRSGRPDSCRAATWRIGGTRVFTSGRMASLDASSLGFTFSHFLPPLGKK